MTDETAGPQLLARLQPVLAVVAGVTAVGLGVWFWLLSSLGTHLAFGGGSAPDPAAGQDVGALLVLLLVGGVLLVAGAASWRDRSWGPGPATGGAIAGAFLGAMLLLDGVVAVGLVSLGVFAAAGAASTVRLVR